MERPELEASPQAFRRVDPRLGRKNGLERGEGELFPAKRQKPATSAGKIPHLLLIDIPNIVQYVIGGFCIFGLVGGLIVNGRRLSKFSESTRVLASTQTMAAGCWGDTTGRGVDLYRELILCMSPSCACTLYMWMHIF